MRLALASMFIAPALALAAASIAVASAFTEAIRAPWSLAVALARECLELFTPASPRLATDGVALVRSIDGQPLGRALLQSLRHESRTPITGAARAI